MVQTDYPIEALTILLDRSCLTARYYPLVPYRERLITGLRAAGCRRKSDAARLPDEAYRQMGLPNAGMILLFRQFLMLYDPKSAKFRGLDEAAGDPREREAFRELFCLPGVGQIRAALYLRSGYGSVQAFAEADPSAVQEAAERTIAAENLPCTPPLPKEVRTQIAAAKAFTWPAEDGETTLPGQNREE